ncbi:LysR family transcriptional regulator [Photobacterium kishitanii]|uniref:LysR family transcriptional regulator n=1 Tax=Photobacterium kishitanii TaxID=318456 RepID=UPI0004363CE5|nr:LysR family transcriptional regulator [Photobacterium kishitanii]OBU22674.1 LysR family transcriptional regulator [Photobacterium kishitanii]PSU90065.1 LysR family transcriptional regulator [Photobacterium kishitanii]PSU97193.1 LysR family transcriptional regulator [Photobacterium kishitanii]PSV21699.1 LysR family transcriptional regulator [Photobacterium kishitanii]PSW71261.1 LysR family transcriptional regulator [Photobacterium kishitanii]
MNLNQLPLNSLRAFFAAAKHQNFTKAAQELCVTQTAVSQQVKGLESKLGITLFNRMPRGISLTMEGVRLFPVVEKVFSDLSLNLDNLKLGADRELINIGVVGTFAINWLLPKLRDFYQSHPHIELRISTNNNIADTFAEGLDYTIRFGRGNWHCTVAEHLFDTPFSALCNKTIASYLHAPQDILQHTLLRSYDINEWSLWFNQAQEMAHCSHTASITFDSTALMMEAAINGHGIALASPFMFQEKIAQGQIVQPFDIYLNKGGYWLTRLDIKKQTPAQIAFKSWLLKQAHQLNNE